MKSLTNLKSLEESGLITLELMPIEIVFTTVMSWMLGALVHPILGAINVIIMVL